MDVDDLRPEVEFGDGFDALVDELDVLETNARKELAFPRHQYTMEEALDFETDVDRQRLQEIAAIIPEGPPTHQKRFTRFCSQFIEAHKYLAKGQLVGKERRKAGFLCESHLHTSGRWSSQ